MIDSPRNRLSRIDSGLVMDATSTVISAFSNFDDATVAVPVTDVVRPFTVTGCPRRVSSTRYPACVRVASAEGPGTTVHAPSTLSDAACVDVGSLSSSSASPAIHLEYAHGPAATTTIISATSVPSPHHR